MRAFAGGVLIVLAAYELTAAVYHSAHGARERYNVILSCLAGGLAAWLLR